MTALPLAGELPAVALELRAGAADPAAFDPLRISQNAATKVAWRAAGDRAEAVAQAMGVPQARVSSLDADSILLQRDQETEELHVR